MKKPCFYCKKLHETDSTGMSVCEECKKEKQWPQEECKHEYLQGDICQDCFERIKPQKEWQDWEKKFCFLMDGLFIPPSHAGTPPIIGWTHWHSKESYENIRKEIQSFISELLESQRQEFLREIATTIHSIPWGETVPKDRDAILTKLESLKKKKI